MKTATNSAPKKCRCGNKLPAPVYGPYPGNRTTYYHNHHIDCSCGSILVWSFPNVWKQWHDLEIGRTLEVVG